MVTHKEAYNAFKIIMNYCEGRNCENCIFRANNPYIREHIPCLVERDNTPVNVPKCEVLEIEERVVELEAEGKCLKNR